MTSFPNFQKKWVPAMQTDQLAAELVIVSAHTQKKRTNGLDFGLKDPAVNFSSLGAV